MTHADVDLSRHLMSGSPLMLDAAEAGTRAKPSARPSISATARATSAGPHCHDAMLMFLIKSSI